MQLDPLKVGNIKMKLYNIPEKLETILQVVLEEHLLLLEVLTPPATTAGTHPIGANVFGCYLATAVATTVEVGPTLPNGTQATEQQFNSITFSLISNATSTETGGGFQCTIGPLNDRA